jgi:cob(I)alamin adenosyltransferase
MDDKANMQKRLGLVHVITGDGKGKTTSGMGIVIRALGRGLRVKIIQLFKKDTGEQYFFEQAKKNRTDLVLEYVQFRPSHPYFEKNNAENLESLKQDVKKFWDAETKDLAHYDLVLIDEAGPGMNWNVLNSEDVVHLIENKPARTELILTGRDFPQCVKEKADYVSEINLEKHPYNEGVPARKGIEF